MADGDVSFAGATSSATVAHDGLALIASGSVHLSAGHTFTACNQSAHLQPEPRLIREIAFAPGQ